MQTSTIAAILCVVLPVSLSLADGPAPKKAKPIRIPKVEGRDTSTNLVAQWKFDEGKGAAIADSTGKYAGALRNGDDKLWTTNRSGETCLKFNGKAYVEVPDFPFMATGPGRSMTIAGWIKPVSGYLISKNTDSNAETNFEFAVSVESGLLSWHGRGAASGQTFLRLDDGAWHHFAVVLDGELGTWFVDGREDSTFQAVNPNGEDKLPLLIGACRTTDKEHIGKYYKGVLRDLRLYNGALTSAAIARLAEAKK